MDYKKVLTYLAISACIGYEIYQMKEVIEKKEPRKVKVSGLEETL
jgi:hypothetical protein